MSSQTKKMTKVVSTIITIGGVVGLFVSGSSDVEVSNLVKVGTMIATVISTMVTSFINQSNNK